MAEIGAPLSNESLCVRLRRERERRQIALSSIAANTKISASLFESLERGDVSRWPSGIYRRSFIRAYADAIGLDADATAREFLEQFPDPREQPPAETAPPPASAPPLIVSAAPSVAAPAKPAVGVRLRVEDTNGLFTAGRLLTDMRRRAVAAGCDAGVVLALALCGFIVFDTFWLPLALTMLAYYLGGILLLGNTPGVCLLANPPRPSAPYNQSSDEPCLSPARGPAHPAWHFRMPAR